MPHRPRAATNTAMSSTNRILLGLVLGLVGGALLLLSGSSIAPSLASVIEPIGAVWLSALKMTIIPLVLALLVTGVASAADAASSGGLTARSLAWFTAFVVAGVFFAVGATEAILWLWPVDPGVAATLTAGANPSAVPPIPSTAETLTGIVPSNIFAALTAGDMLPIVLFGMVLGFAVTRIGAEPREKLLGLFRAVSETMFVIIGWVLWLAPLGVFALAFSVGFRTGFEAVAAIAQYVIIVSAVLILQMLLISYPAVAIWGKVGLVRFTKAALPAQAVALGTQSSLATLPAMLDASAAMGVSERVRSLVLPLAVALFRSTSASANLVVVLFVAHLSGVELSWAQLALGMAIAAIGSIAVVGVASASTFFVVTVPISLAMGVPVGVLPLLLAVEILPDLWRTVGNVTSDMAVAVIADAQDD